jgi:hypothetical protein
MIDGTPRASDESAAGVLVSQAVGANDSADNSEAYERPPLTSVTLTSHPTQQQPIQARREFLRRVAERC